MKLQFVYIYMFQDTPFKFSLYDSEYYVKSLEINISGKIIF